VNFLKGVLIVATGAVVLLALARPAIGQAADGAKSAAERAAAGRLQRGDRILLRVVREPELSDSVFVTERGDAAFPKIGTINVVAMTIAELQDTLRARYAEFLRAPAIQVVVLRRVVVNGEVRNPNVYFVDVSTTLRDVIARAGGFTDNGDRRKVAIVRGEQRIPAPRWDSDGGSAGDLLSGDQVYVGRKNWWVINALPAISTAVVLGSFILSLRN
jgi:polysaccharide export outer membrane protein